MLTIFRKVRKKGGIRMEKRVIYNFFGKQFVLIPTVGILPKQVYFKFRIGFLFGPFALSIGCFRRKHAFWCAKTEQSILAHVWHTMIRLFYWKIKVF